MPLSGSGAFGSLAVRSAPTGSAAARQHTGAMRFSLPGATRAARPTASGTTARLRLLGRELARAQQLPPPRAPRAQTAAPTIFVRQSDAESVGGCKNEKNEDSESSEKTAFRHWRPGQFVLIECAVVRVPSNCGRAR